MRSLLYSPRLLILSNMKDTSNVTQLFVKQSNQHAHYESDSTTNKNGPVSRPLGHKEFDGDANRSKVDSNLINKIPRQSTVEVRLNKFGLLTQGKHQGAYCYLESDDDTDTHCLNGMAGYTVVVYATDSFTAFVHLSDWLPTLEAMHAFIREQDWLIEWRP